MRTSCFERIIGYLDHSTGINGGYFDKREYCNSVPLCSNDCRIDNLMDLLSLMAEFFEDESEVHHFEPDLQAFLPDLGKTSFHFKPSDIHF